MTEGGRCAPGSVWHTGVYFVPGYDNGIGPFGIWYCYELWIPRTHVHDNPLQDYGGVILHRQGVRTVSSVAGTLKFGSSPKPGKIVTIIGHPGNFAAGERQQACAVSLKSIPAVTPGLLAATLCDLRGGASGGPWIVDGLMVSNSSKSAQGLRGIGDLIVGPDIDVAAHAFRAHLIRREPPIRVSGTGR